MNNSKKFLMGVLAVSMVMSAAGCGKQETKVDPNTPEDLMPEKIGYYSTLKLPIDTNNTKIEMICDTSVSTNNDSVVVKELRRRTGLDVQVVAIPRSTIQEKVKILVASSNDMPDIVGGGFTIDEYNDLAKQGAFECISDHLDELPNLNEICYDKSEEYGTTGKIKNIMSGDGKLYLFPTYDVNRDVNHGFLYRKDIFDKNGIKMWTNTNEFLDALRKLKKAYPDSTPFASKTGTNIFRDFSFNYGLNGFDMYYNEDSKKWIYSPMDEKFKDVLDLLKTMYDEGLIDPEFITATQPAWTTKMTTEGKAFVTWDWIGRMDPFKEQTKSTIPGYDLRYAEPLEGKVRTLEKITGGPAVKKGKNSLLAMKLLDYLISESGARLVTCGIEGVTFNWDENGYATYVGLEGDANSDINKLEEKYGLFISGMYRRFDRKSGYFKFSEKEQEAQDMMNNKKDGYWPEDPVLSFNEEEKKVITDNFTNIKTAATEFATNYILTTKTGDKAWNEWLATAKKMGVEKIEKAYNDAQKRYDSIK